MACAPGPGVATHSGVVVHRQFDLTLRTQLASLANEDTHRNLPLSFGALWGAPQAPADGKPLDDPFCDRDFIALRKSGYIEHVRNEGRIFHFDGRHRRRLYRVIMVDEFQWYAAESKTNLVLLVKCQFDWDPVWNWRKTEFRSSQTNQLLCSIDESGRLVILSFAKPPSLLRRYIHSVFLLWIRLTENQEIIEPVQ
jgi:hypothetical protein